MFFCCDICCSLYEYIYIVPQKCLFVNFLGMLKLISFGKYEFIHKLFVIMLKQLHSIQSRTYGYKLVTNINIAYFKPVSTIHYNHLKNHVLQCPALGSFIRLNQFSSITSSSKCSFILSKHCLEYGH